MQLGNVLKLYTKLILPTIPHNRLETIINTLLRDKISLEITPSNLLILLLVDSILQALLIFSPFFSEAECPEQLAIKQIVCSEVV